MRFDQFTGGSYVSQSPVADLQRCMNWYPELIESGVGKNPRYWLAPTPGVEAFATLPRGPLRGLYANNTRMFAMGGSSLYELDDAAVITERGAGLAIDPNPAVMASNGDAGNQLLIGTGGQASLLNLTTNVLTTPLTSGVRTVDFLDGYFMGLNADTGTFRISDLNDGSSWPAAQVQQRNNAADRWIGMRVVNRLIYLWGSQTGEVWYNAGTSPMPFAAIQEAFMPYGILGSFAHCAGAQGPLWIDGSKHGRGIIYRAQGYTPQRVSNHAIEFAIQRYTTVSDVVAYSYQEEGHPFALFTFPTANATQVWDDATSLWHERGYWDQPVMAYRAHRPLWHCFAFGQHFVGDRLGSTIYRQRTSATRDVNNVEIRRLRRSPHVNQEDRMLGVSRFALELQPGVGATTGLGATPLIMMRYSVDQGQTWSSELQVSAGQVGDYLRRCEWRRLGRGRDFVFEVIVSDPVAWRIINAYLDVN